MENLIALIQNYFSVILFYLPLGIVGIWRWLVWVFKKTVSYYYKPITWGFSASVSIVTPVYNEDPTLFKKALLSWAKNSPEEIIAVIDYTDLRCIEVFRDFAKKYKRARLLITKIPGKRAALADGIKAARGEIVALVDSDILWEENVIKNSLSPFKDPRVAGVTTRENVIDSNSLAQKLFDINLDLRYFLDYPFMAAAGDAVVCLTGRTSFYRREVIRPMTNDLINETFMGKKVVSGDDKRLTYLVLKAGWKVGYQGNARIYTPGMRDLKSYLKQRLRWTRNGLRSDLRAMMEGWSWKHPALAFYQVDKFVQAPAILLSPIYFLLSLFEGYYLGAAIIATWWFLSRTIKLYPHLKRKPEDILVLPVFILYTFLSALLKIYAFFTLNTSGWMTRWDKSRLPQIKFMQQIPGYAMSAIVLVILTSLVFNLKGKSINGETKVASITSTQTKSLVFGKIDQKEASPAATQAIAFYNSKGELIKGYQVKTGDTLSTIAYKFNIEPEDLLEANIQVLPNWSKIEPGLILSIPYQDFQVGSAKQYSHTIKNLPTATISYAKDSNTINILGRGTQVSLKDIYEEVGDKHLVKLKDKEWLLKANLKIGNGVTVKLDKSQVTWLKMASGSQSFTWIRVNGGSLSFNGVKVTSWDEVKNDYDKDEKNGRSFIMAKYSSRMDVYDSELAYLGFFPKSPIDGSSYGVAWKIPNDSKGKYLSTGEVKNSKFHHNYFGAYTYGATAMVWQNNEFYSNIQYGLDPHDDSNNFLVENNTFHDNGNHGIIFSKRCINNIIRNNLSYNNKLHGIMLDRNSNDNIVEGNTVYGNKDGIALYDSSRNIIKNNTIKNNQRGFRANMKSEENIITNNQFSNNKQFGIYLYGQANKNNLVANNLTANTNAVYIKTSANLLADNTIVQNKVGVYLLDYASDNQLSNNTISNNRSYGVFNKTAKGSKNYLDDNTIHSNGQNIYTSSVSKPNLLSAVK
ncbi:right-handed parallel beta-helix repeat-containing protein [Candidatus Daviesbacteria bacterium]|nr:right-handed parallel beta-helix repeat-containing protein [Candidatus Daviesbacteria bacterium]